MADRPTHEQVKRAISVIKTEMRRQGKKPSDYEAKEIVKAAKELIQECPEEFPR